MENRTRVTLLMALVLAFSCRDKEPQATDTATTTVSATETTATTATTQPPFDPMKVDHFKFWTVKPVSFDDLSVQLKGQFDKEPYKASVRALTHIGNPVEKNGEAPQDAYHLTVYRLDPHVPPPPKWVILTNQLQKDVTWKLHAPSEQRPQLLLVPATKGIEVRPDTTPGHGDHYVCYVATAEDIPANKTIPGKVELLDQFDKLLKKPEILEKLSPAYFCVPVQKNAEKLTNEKTHLALYRIYPSTQFGKTAFTLDQFGPQELTVDKSELLAVPSEKRDFAKQ